jgi:hypothetical protein
MGRLFDALVALTRIVGPFGGGLVRRSRRQVGARFDTSAAGWCRLPMTGPRQR